MTGYEIAVHNAEKSSLVNKYWHLLLEALNESIGKYEGYAAQATITDSGAYGGASDPVVFAIPEKDSSGSFIRYKSSNAELKLYRNQPIGWIFGEVKKAAPLSSQKFFAFQIVSSGHGGDSDHLSPVGCYSKSEDMTIAGLAKQLLEDLALGTVAEDDLTSRTTLA